MTQNNHKHTAAPGRVHTSALLCGAVGLLVSGAMYWVGLLGKGDSRIFETLRQPVFRGAVPSELSVPVLFLVTTLFCFGLAFAVLDSPGVWRRVVLGLTLLVLVIAMVPTLAVWNIYFPPMMSLVGVFWTWFAGMMYASHHQMPCDDRSPVVQQPQPAEVKPEPVVEKKKPTPNAKKKTAAKKSKKKAKVKKEDPDAKYKPK